ncbi:MAG: phospholipid carrier-dependent glycosyltransferase [Oligoflexia bacterium]|nr:phospholipid carrier-dependent glycosyltransferase [Oligoflexia bacterium]
MATQRKLRLLIGLVAFLLAIAARLTGLFHGVGFNNDEGSVLSDAAALSLSALEPRSFVYGSLTYYIPAGTGAIARLFGAQLSSYEDWSIVGRIVSALLGSLCVVAAAALAYNLFSSIVIAFLAGLLLALNPLHIQLSHFYTPDNLLTLWTTAALACSVAALQSGKKLHLVLTSIFCAAGLATKISAVMLVPLILVGPFMLRPVGQDYGFAKQLRSAGMLFLLTGVCTFVFQPYVFLHLDKFIFDVGGQFEMVRGLGLTTWNFQYLGTPALLYPLQQFYSYTLGPLVSVLALVGLIASIFRARSEPSWRLVLPLLWALPYFISTSSSVVKFSRYYLPLIPLFTCYAAFGANQLVLCISRALPSSWPESNVRMLERIVLAGIVFVGVSHGAALSLLYLKPHSFEVASHWICANVPEGAKILQIPWDSNLPRCGDLPAPPHYEMDPAKYELPLYLENDLKDPVPRILELLEEGDYLIIPTPRIIRSLFPVTHIYPDANTVLQLIFSGQFGYSLKRSFTVRPRLGPIIFDDTLADESFTVHDRPRVLLFENEKHLSRDALRRVFMTAKGVARPLTLTQLLSMSGGE